jgi:hypothetical protein
VKWFLRQKRFSETITFPRGGMRMGSPIRICASLLVSPTTTLPRVWTMQRVRQAFPSVSRNGLRAVKLVRGGESTPCFFKCFLPKNRRVNRCSRHYSLSWEQLFLFGLLSFWLMRGKTRMTISEKVNRNGKCGNRVLQRSSCRFR